MENKTGYWLLSPNAINIKKRDSRSQTRGISKVHLSQVTSQKIRVAFSIWICEIQLKKNNQRKTNRPFNRFLHVTTQKRLNGQARHRAF